MATIFVVDDDEGYRGLLRVLLEEKGHQVEEAPSGTTVLRKVEQMKPPPNLFIVDLRMPDMNGFELAQRLREHEKTRDTPILMLTGSGEGVRDLAEREGVVFLQKLIASNEEILDHVQRLLLRGKPRKVSRVRGEEKPLEIDRGFDVTRTAVRPQAPQPPPPEIKPAEAPPPVAPVPQAAAVQEPAAKEGIDRESFDELVLAMIWYNQHATGSAAKTFDGESMERLFREAMISDPKSKSKWVILSGDGEKKGQAAFFRYFGDPGEPKAGK